MILVQTCLFYSIFAIFHLINCCLAGSSSDTDEVDTTLTLALPGTDPSTAHFTTNEKEKVQKTTGLKRKREKIIEIVDQEVKYEGPIERQRRLNREASRRYRQNVKNNPKMLEQYIIKRRERNKKWYDGVSADPLRNARRKELNRKNVNEFNKRKRQRQKESKMETNADSK